MFKQICIPIFVCISIMPATANADFLISDNQAGNRVLRYDDAGNFIRTEIESGSGGISGPNGMAIVGDELLVASQNNGQIFRYDLKTRTPLGTFASGIAGPTQITAVGGSILTGSFAGTEIAGYELDGTAEGDFTSGGSLDGIASFVFGSNGDLYVGDFNGGEVEVYDGSTGVFQEVFATGLGAGITGLTFDDSGNLWLSSLFTHDIIQLDADGNELTRFNTGGIGSGAAGDGTFPSDIVLNPDGSGELLIGLTGEGGVFRFDSSGNNLGEFTTGDGGAFVVTGKIFEVASIPEPTSVAILVGLLLCGGVSRKRKP